jgi:hypothetical protein
MNRHGWLLLGCLFLVPAQAAHAAAGDCLRLDATAAATVLDFAFCGDSGGWSGGFADLPPGGLDDPIFDLRFARAELPAATGARGEGLRLAGSNRSDDLFLFVKRQITGLRPSTRYAVEFGLWIATNAGRGCVGIGGAPGEAVHVKAGASALEPRVDPREGVLRLNLDIGSQAQAGRDALVLGDVAAAGARCDGSRYVIKRLSSQGQPFFPLTDRDGNLWLIVGFDSGFEGRSDLFLQRIRVELAPVRR